MAKKKTDKKGPTAPREMSRVLSTRAELRVDLPDPDDARPFGPDLGISHGPTEPCIDCGLPQDHNHNCPMQKKA